jgi:hypothetical protein
VLIANGHDLDDIKYKYSTEQVYKFYEMCQKKEYDYYKTMAISMYNAIACGSIPDNQKTSQEQKKAWRKFIDHFDWDKLMRKAKAKPDPKKAFQGLPMIRNRGVK